MYTLEVWRDGPGQGKPVAAFPMTESTTSKGLFHTGGGAYSEVELRRGFAVEVHAERVPTGEIHLSATHRDESGMFMSAFGPVTVRMFSRDGPSYVIALRKNDA